VDGIYYEGYHWPERIGMAKQATRALARIQSWRERAAPLGRALADAGSAALDGWMSRVQGEDYSARIARVPVSLGSSGVDAFGFDPEWARVAMPACAFLHRKYFRTEVFGAEHVPAGRVLLIANHSGQLPFDGAVIAAAMFMDTEPPRFVRAMVEKWTQTLPFVSMFFSRVGQVVGVPENAKRLLEAGEALLVFPEGVRGISKTFERRYQLTDFGLGFMRLAMETNTPVIPIAVIGAEEQYVSVANADKLARIFSLPAFPVIPQLALAGILPLPTRYRLYFGEPMHFSGDPDDEDAIIEEKVWLVRATIQSMLNRGLKARKSIFW